MGGWRYTCVTDIAHLAMWSDLFVSVEYQKGQEPYLLKTGSYNHTGPSIVSMSPDGRVVAIATRCNISVYNAETTELAQTFKDAHSSKYSIRVGQN